MEEFLNKYIIVDRINRVEAGWWPYNLTVAFFNSKIMSNFVKSKNAV